MDARESELNCGCGTTSSAAFEQIEQDIGATRARLDNTVGAIQERLTVRNLANSAAHVVCHGAGAGSRAALRTIKNNPVPAALVGLGVAWLIMDKYRARSHSRAMEHGGYGDRDWLAPGATYTPGGRGFSGSSIGSSIREGTRTAAATAADTARSAAGWAKDKASTVAGTVGGKVSAGASAMGERASKIAQSGKAMAGRTRDGFWDNYDDNPLMIGAAAFTLGLVGGLSVPTSKTEDRLMGRASKNLKDQVRSAGEQAMEAGKQVASRAADAVQCSSSDAETIGGRLAGTLNKVTESVADEVVCQADKAAKKFGGSSLA